MNTFNIINSVLTFLLAVVVCIIVYRQNKNDVHANRLSLYDRRFKIYQETKTLLRKLVGGPLELEDFFDIDESFFLFKKSDIYDYLVEIRNRTIDYKRICADIDSECKRVNNNIDRWYNNEKWNEMIQDKGNQDKWFLSEYETVENRFMKYLDFRKDEPVFTINIFEPKYWQKWFKKGKKAEPIKPVEPIENT